MFTSRENRAHPWATKLACDDYCGDTLIFSSHTPTVRCNGDTCSVVPLHSFTATVNDIDGSWEEWADDFGWWDDKNGDGNQVDPCEWGEVIIENESWGEMDSMIWTGYVDSIGDTITWGLPTTGLGDYHIVVTGLFNADENPILGTGFSEEPQHLILIPMLYGDKCFEYADSSCVEISD